MLQIEQHIHEFAEDNPYAVTLNDFIIKDVIGKGGFGEVYRAKQKSTGFDCALKKVYATRLAGKHLKRYLNEITIMSKTNNLFLIPFVGFTLTSPYCVVTAYMENGSLDKYLLSRVPPKILTGSDLTKIALGVAYGMDSLHSYGIIHRDLKAGNVLLDSDFLPKICDFGISTFETNDGEMTGKIGTPNYMAPELIVSNEYTNKVDVYSYAMLLYEMSEGKRPFKGLKPNDIFNCVIMKDIRPQLTDRTPHVLKELINKCWAKDPDERPSFKEIYKLFADGKVYFNGTDRTQIVELLKLIDFEKSHKIKLQKNRIHVSKEPSEPSTESENGDSYDYEEEEYDSENEKEQQNKANVKIARSPARFFSSILSDPNKPDFHKNLDKYAREVDCSLFNEFFSPLYTLLYNQLEAVPIMKAAQLMMDRDIQFILFFNYIDFFNMLPMRTKVEIDNALECLSFIFTEMPTEISSRHLPIINTLLKKRPKKMLILHSFYVRSFEIISDPYVLLDNLRKFESVFMSKSVGYLYISILYFAVVNFSDYKEKRKTETRASIVKFLKAKDVQTITTVYDSITNLGIELKGYKSASKHLNNSELWNSVVSALMRQKHIKCTKKLLEMLLLRSHMSPRPWIVLLNIASTKGGSKFLLENCAWMDEALRHPIEVAKLFLIIFSRTKLKEKCIRLDGFPTLMLSLLDSGDQKMHRTATTIIRRAPQTEELLEILSRTGIIKAYIETTINSGNEKIYKNSLLLFDAISRVGYMKEYINYAPLLVDLVQDQKYMSDAITVIVSMSFFPPLARFFRERKLDSFFTKLSEIENFREAASIMLYNLYQ